jgi:hypothetical protein
MGEIVGMAASLCQQHGSDPRSVYSEHLEELQALMARGVGRPSTLPTLEHVGPNVARAAKVSTSGDRDAAASPATLINDGLAELRRNELRWLSHAQTPNWVEFRWDQPQQIAAARVVSGYTSGGQTVEPIASFVLQTGDGSVWRDIPGTDTAGNRDVVWQRTFDPIATSHVRLLVRATKGDISRIWEVELLAAEGSRPLLNLSP